MEWLTLIANVLASTLRLSSPLIFAAMAGLLSYQVGLINIALEGLMLVGAFTAVVVGFSLGSAWLGVLAAVIVCSMFGAFFALLVTDFKADLIVTGLAVNILAAGVTAYLLQIWFGTSGTFAPPDLEQLPRLDVAFLTEIPFLGRVLFRHSALVYLSWVSVPVTAWFLYRTVPGMRIRAVGENGEAAATAGVSVRRMQYLALTLGGALCGLGGAHLAVGALSLFREDMTAGRGFIALAAVYFAGGRPRLAVLACLLFGLFEAMQFRLQTMLDVPTQFFQMLPYLMVVVMLVLISVRREWRSTDA